MSTKIVLFLARHILPLSLLFVTAYSAELNSSVIPLINEGERLCMPLADLILESNPDDLVSKYILPELKNQWNDTLGCLWKDATFFSTTWNIFIENADLIASNSRELTANLQQALILIINGIVSFVCTNKAVSGSVGCSSSLSTSELSQFYLQPLMESFNARASNNVSTSIAITIADLVNISNVPRQIPISLDSFAIQIFHLNSTPADFC